MLQGKLQKETEEQKMSEYEKGYADGVRDLAVRIIKYYSNLKGNTYPALVVYTVKNAANSLSVEIKGGEGYVLPSEEPK